MGDPMPPDPVPPDPLAQVPDPAPDPAPDLVLGPVPEPARATGASQSVHILHLSLAEHGKLCLLRHDFGEALRHFREAIRLCVSARAPDVFFRHYTQCVLEALEKAGDYGQVADYCRKADAHYGAAGLETALHRKDHGAILERLGIMELRQGRPGEAAITLARAVARAGGGVLPLAEQLAGWLRRGLATPADRLMQLQVRHGYYAVRDGTVNAGIARELPREPAAGSLRTPVRAPVRAPAGAPA